MVDEFMVCVDRIIASAACFQESSSSVNNDGRETQEECVAAAENGCLIISNGCVNKEGIFNGNGGEGCSFSSVKAKGSVRECRICQEEDEENDMESPCACNGTLKFAHRKCIQKWCNKKGDITCEICNQVFSPDYTSPPPRSNADVMAIDIRQAWGPHIDLRDPRLMAFAAAERQFLQSEYDNYAIANSGTLTCFRSVAIIRLWDAAGVISFLPLSDISAAAGWFSSSLLCGCPFMVHCTMSKEEAGLRKKVDVGRISLKGGWFISIALCCN